MIDSEWVCDLEKLANLWQVGTTWRQINKTLDGDEVWATHTSMLREALRHHASNSAKPTSALWARTELVLMDLTDAAIKLDSLPCTLISIKEILREAETHLDYPFEPVVQIVQELGRLVGGDDTYNELFETIIQFQAKRVGKAEEGRMRLERGYQKLKVGKFYDAIDQFAKAQSLLTQNEHKGEFVRAVLQGRLWAMSQQAFCGRRGLTWSQLWIVRSTNISRTDGSCLKPFLCYVNWFGSRYNSDGFHVCLLGSNC